MKYLDSLKSKGLELGQLSKSIQTKVEQLEELNGKVALLESSELSEEEKSTLEELKVGVLKEDDYISRKINLFDLQKYDKKIATFNGMMEKKKNARLLGPVEPKVKKVKAKVITEPEVPVAPVVTTEPVVIPEGEVAPVVQTETVPNIIDDIPIVDALTFLNTELAEQGGIVEPEVNLETAPEPETVYPEEVEEFEKVEDAKPKNLSMWFIVIGIGVALMTVGAVNILKKK